MSITSLTPSTEKVWGPRARGRWKNPQVGGGASEAVGRHREASGRRSPGNRGAGTVMPRGAEDRVEPGTAPCWTLSGGEN